MRREMGSCLVWGTISSVKWSGPALDLRVKANVPFRVGAFRQVLYNKVLLASRGPRPSRDASRASARSGLSGGAGFDLKSPFVYTTPVHESEKVLMIRKVVLVQPYREGSLLGKAPSSPYTLMRLASLVPDTIPVEIWDENLGGVDYTPPGQGRPGGHHLQDGERRAGAGDRRRRPAALRGGGGGRNPRHADAGGCEHVGRHRGRGRGLPHLAPADPGLRQRPAGAAL